MVEHILNLLLIPLEIAVFVIWLIGICNSDGKCHMDSCEDCFYSGNCPEERRRKDEDR